MSKSPMEGVLSTTQSYSPLAWVTLVHQNDPQDHYVVTRVSHYKQRYPWPAFQPEYLTLLVQPHPDHPQPGVPPTLIRVSRDVRGHALPARLGLWGHRDDTVTVLGPATDVQLHDEQLHHLAWTPDEAPRLEIISCFIACIHYDIPQSCLLLSSACCAFVHAVLESIHIAFNGFAGDHQPEFLIPNAHVVYLVRPGTPSAHEIALSVATRYIIFNREESRVEEARQRSCIGISYFSLVFPVEVKSVRWEACSLAQASEQFRSAGM